MAEWVERFEAKVDRSGDCHLWTGAKTAGGVGQIRVQGKLRTAAQVGWELEHGSLSAGDRIRSCAINKLCVRVEHLTLKTPAPPAETPRRADRDRGSVQELSPGRWKLTIDIGHDSNGNRRRRTRTIKGTRTDATRALAALNQQTQSAQTIHGHAGAPLTVTNLVDWYLTFARDTRGLERSTIHGYHETFNLWLRPHIGHIPAEQLTPAQIDDAFGVMRNEGKSHSRMNNARSALSGAYKWGRRHRHVHNNPMRDFELPSSSHTPATTIVPETDQLRFLLDEAQTLDPEFAPVLLLAATTGMRRGELSGLRRSHLRLSHGELTVERSISEINGELEDKPTKTNQSRLIRLDEATLAFIRSHLDHMDQRAVECGTTIADNGFVFSLEPNCAVPMRPDLLTRRMRRIRKHLRITKTDFDANILAMRKWTSTELMDAGFNPSTVSERQGHTVRVMLNNYSSRRSSADQAAADHLGAQVFGVEKPE